MTSDDKFQRNNHSQCRFLQVCNYTPNKFIFWPILLMFHAVYNSAPSLYCNSTLRLLKNGSALYEPQEVNHVLLVVHSRSYIRNLFNEGHF